MAICSLSQTQLKYKDKEGFKVKGKKESYPRHIQNKPNCVQLY